MRAPIFGGWKVEHGKFPQMFNSGSIARNRRIERIFESSKIEASLLCTNERAIAPPAFIEPNADVSRGSRFSRNVGNVLTLCAYTKVCSAVIKGIAVFVVHIYRRRNAKKYVVYFDYCDSVYARFVREGATSTSVMFPAAYHRPHFPYEEPVILSFIDYRVSPFGKRQPLCRLSFNNVNGGIDRRMQSSGAALDAKFGAPLLPSEARGTMVVFAESFSSRNIRRSGYRLIINQRLDSLNHRLHYSTPNGIVRSGRTNIF